MVAYSRPRRVLIVDDEDNFAVMTRAMLASDSRVEVVGRVRHGREALTMAAAVNPDVILMDLEMPVMDGIEATRLLREQGSTARIIVLTGGEDPREISAAREAGADTYIVKPQTAEALVAAILRDAD